MPSDSSFNGFPKETIRFYRGLSKNNDKTWFDAHKDLYREKVLAPAALFVEAMGEELRKLSPAVIADPRTSGAGSIFRIYRDTRFSKDKRPYKTHLGIFFWEGGAKKRENPGFYVHLEPPNLMLAAGAYMFTKLDLEAYRDAVVDSRSGRALPKAIKKVTSKGYDVGGRHYKRVPRGYEPDHPNAEYLLFNGLYAYTEGKIPQEFHSKRFLRYCFERFEDMYPMHDWIMRAIR